MRNPKMYVASFEKEPICGMQDLFEIVAPQDKRVSIYRVVLQFDTGSPPPSGIVFHRGITKGFGGRVVVPSPLYPNCPSFGGTVMVNNKVLSETDWIIIDKPLGNWGKYRHEPSEIDRIVIAPSERLVINLRTCYPLMMTGEVVFEEIGLGENTWQQPKLS